jgi:hypothetical protein
LVFSFNQWLQSSGRTPLGASFPDAVPSYGDAVDRRVRQRRVPFRRHGRRRIFIQLANTSAGFVALVFKRNIRLSFALRPSEAARLFVSPSRSTGPAFWNLYPARLSL